MPPRHSASTAALAKHACARSTPNGNNGTVQSRKLVSLSMPIWIAMIVATAVTFNYRVTPVVTKIATNGHTTITICARLPAASSSTE